MRRLDWKSGLYEVDIQTNRCFQALRFPDAAALAHRRLRDRKSFSFSIASFGGIITFQALLEIEL